MPTKRLGVVIVPNGAPREYWTPEAAGANFELTPSLQALEPVRDQVAVLTGLYSVGAARPGVGTSHSAAAAAFLTGAKAKRTAGSALQLGISMDQVAANRAGTRARDAAALAGALAGGRRHRLWRVDLRRRLQLCVPE